MTSIRCAACLLLSLALVAMGETIASAEDSNREKAAFELFRVMKLEASWNSSVDQLAAAQTVAKPQLAPFKKMITQFFHKHMGWKSMQLELAKLYVEQFSEQEIVELTQFYKSPLGQKVLKALPALTGKTMQIGQKRLQSQISELQKMIDAERAKKKLE